MAEARPVRWRESSVVTCVIANTNTRSQSSSSGLVRRSATGLRLVVDPGLRRDLGHGRKFRSPTQAGCALALGRALERSRCGRGRALALDPFQRALVLVVAPHHARPRPAVAIAKLGRPVGSPGRGSLAGCGTRLRRSRGARTQPSGATRSRRRARSAEHPRRAGSPRGARSARAARARSPGAARVTRAPPSANLSHAFANEIMLVRPPARWAASIGQMPPSLL